MGNSVSGTQRESDCSAHHLELEIRQYSEHSIAPVNRRTFRDCMLSSDDVIRLVFVIKTVIIILTTYLQRHGTGKFAVSVPVRIVLVEFMVDERI